MINLNYSFNADNVLVSGWHLFYVLWFFLFFLSEQNGFQGWGVRERLQSIWDPRVWGQCHPHCSCWWRPSFIAYYLTITGLWKYHQSSSMCVRTEGGAWLVAKLRVVMDLRSRHQLNVSLGGLSREEFVMCRICFLISNKKKKVKVLFACLLFVFCLSCMNKTDLTWRLFLLPQVSINHSLKSWCHSPFLFTLVSSPRCCNAMPKFLHAAL